MELTNSLVANSGTVDDDDFNDLFREEEEDTAEEVNINVRMRPVKKSRAETKKMSDDELFLCRASGMSIAAASNY